MLKITTTPKKLKKGTDESGDPFIPNKVDITSGLEIRDFDRKTGQ